MSSSLEHSIPFHYLVNMVDSEEITVEKIKTQQFSLEINTLSDTFQQNTSIEDTPPESSPRVKAVDPKNKSKPQFKSIARFVTKTIILFLHVMVDSKCIKNLNPNQIYLLLHYTNILKHPPIYSMLHFLNIVVEVIVIPIINFLVTLDKHLALIHAQTLVLTILIKPIPIIFLHTMIVTDLAMINTIKNLLKTILLFSPLI